MITLSHKVMLAVIASFLLLVIGYGVCRMVREHHVPVDPVVEKQEVKVEQKAEVKEEKKK